MAPSKFHNSVIILGLLPLGAVLPGCGEPGAHDGAAAR